MERIDFSSALYSMIPFSELKKGMMAFCWVSQISNWIVLVSNDHTKSSGPFSNGNYRKTHPF